MNQGHVQGLFIAPAAGAGMGAVQSVRAVPGQGLEGDRYFKRNGTFAKNGKLPPGKEVTLIEIEALEGLEREYFIRLENGASRRNIVTRGVALNHLVGREFNVGGARIKGVKLCEPCGHLEKLTAKGVRRGLIHRGGLRAQILSEGVIHIGDAITAAALDRSAACA